MKEYLKTMRQQGMQQQMQEPPEKEKTENKMKVYGDDGVELYGNEDAKTLSKVYKALSKNGLTDEEKKALKTFDLALKGAELIATSDDVTLIQDKDTQKEATFVVLGNDLKQNAGFVNSKPGKSK